MRPGHPFLTEELDEHRARQRRVFRLIPDWIIERTATPSPPGPLETPDAALIETELRRLADEDITALKTELEDRARYAQLSVVNPWLRGTDVEARPNAIGETVRALEAEAEAAYTDRYDDKQYRWHYARLYALLKWADQLADDYYTDPRIVADS